MSNFVFTRALLLVTICALTLTGPAKSESMDRIAGGAAGVVVGAAVTHETNRRRMIELLYKVMVNRLSAGLSVKEVHVEMSRLAPTPYWEYVVAPRLCQEAAIESTIPIRGAAKLCPQRLKYAKKTRARRAALKAQFEAEDRLRPGAPLSFAQLIYRSKRLLDGASEQQVHCEFAFVDVKYENSMVAQGFDVKKCDRPF